MKLKIKPLLLVLVLLLAQLPIHGFEIEPVNASPDPEWSIETVDSDVVGACTSIALDEGGNPHISYYDETNGDLKYARWTGSAWSIETVDSDGCVGMSTSIALDEGGNPHISYYDWDNMDLKYARWVGAATEPTTPEIEFLLVVLVILLIAGGFVIVWKVKSK